MQTDFSQAPEFIEAQALVARAEEAASDYKIATPQQYTDSATMLKRIKASQARLEELRTAITGPMNAALRAVNDLFRVPADRLAKAERSIKSEITRYTDEQRRLQQEEQRKADEAARKERERIERQAARAEDKGQTEKAAELTQRAETVVAPVIVREPPKIPGISMREVATFEIVDASQLPREYLMPDEKKIRAVVNVLKQETKIPGVVVRIEKQVAAGSR